MMEQISYGPTTLRAVKPGETVTPPKTAATVAQAAESGSHRDLLVAMRDRIAKTITGDCPPRDLASLTRRLQDIAKEIEQIDRTESQESDEQSVADDDWSAEVI